MQELIQNNSPKFFHFGNRFNSKAYEAEIKSLIEQGYTNERMNFKALRKNNGNIELAIGHLKYKLEKLAKRPTFEEKVERAKQVIIERGYEAQSQKLKELGLEDIRLQARLLKRYSGKIEPIAERLVQKSGNHEKVEKKPEGFNRHHKDFHQYKVKEEKVQDEKASNIKVFKYDDIPENVNTIYLDGNNMLFCENEIRGLVLSQRRLDAEHVLSDIALAFGLEAKRYNFVLVYDRTTFNLNWQIKAEDKILDYSVLSAAPLYSTSDDALVDWAKDQGGNAKNCLFVTSDRELQQRLTRVGVAGIMKPGKWLSMVKATLGGEKYNTLLNSKTK